MKKNMRKKWKRKRRTKYDVKSAMRILNLKMQSKHESSKKHRKNLKQQEKKSNNTKVKIEKPDEESKLSKKGNTRKGKNKKRDEDNELMLKDDIEGEQASHTETEDHNEAKDAIPQSSFDTDDIKKKEETATSEVSDNDGEDSEEEELPSVKVKVGKQQQKKKKRRQVRSVTMMG